MREARLFTLMLSIVVWMSASLAAQAQTLTYRLTGKVTDKVSGETLPFANVFLANTTYGIAADADGVFELEVPMSGAYLLVVRYIGYESYKLEVRLEEEQELEFVVKLDQQAGFAGEHVVTGRRGRNYYDEDGRRVSTKGMMWKVYLNHFERGFLGMSNFGLASKIDNPEVLSFVINEEDSSFIAQASDAIEVINGALGYKITYTLEGFEMSFSKKTVVYKGYPLFTEMEPRNEKQRTKWKRNRWEAYRGSFRHFLTAAYHGEIARAGFEARVLDLAKFSNEDMTEDMAFREFNFYSDFTDSDLPASSKNTGAKTMIFPDVLLITDGNNIEDQGYIQPPQQAMLFGWQPAPQQRYLQRSWLRLVEGAKLEIASNGYLFNPMDVTVYGYWAFERVGELLPFYFDQVNMNDQ